LSPDLSLSWELDEDTESNKTEKLPHEIRMQVKALTSTENSKKNEILKFLENLNKNSNIKDKITYLYLAAAWEIEDEEAIKILKTVENLLENWNYDKIEEILNNYSPMPLKNIWPELGMMPDNETSRQLAAKYAPLFNRDGVDPYDPNEIPVNKYGEEEQVWRDGNTLKLKVWEQIISIPEWQNFYMDAEWSSFSDLFKNNEDKSWEAMQPFNINKLEEALVWLPEGWEVDILIKPTPKAKKQKYITLKRVKDSFQIKEIHPASGLQPDENEHVLRRYQEGAKAESTVERMDLSKEVDTAQIEAEAKAAREQIAREREALLKDIEIRRKAREPILLTDREIDLFRDNPKELLKIWLEQLNGIEQWIESLIKLNNEKVIKLEKKLIKWKDSLSEEEKAELEKAIQALELKSTALDRSLSDTRIGLEEDFRKIKIIESVPSFRREYIDKYTIAKLDREVTPRETQELINLIKKYRDDYAKIWAIDLATQARKKQEETLAKHPKTIEISPTTTGVRITTANLIFETGVWVEAGGLALKWELESMLWEDLVIKIKANNSPLTTEILASLNISPDKNNQFIINAWILGKLIELGDEEKKVWQKNFEVWYKRKDLKKNAILKEISTGIIYAQVDNTNFWIVKSETATEKITTYHALAGWEAYKAYLSGEIELSERINLELWIEAEYQKLYEKYDQSTENMLAVWGNAKLTAQLTEDIKAFIETKVNSLYQEYWVGIELKVDETGKITIKALTRDYNSDYPSDNAQDMYLEARYTKTLDNWAEASIYAWGNPNRLEKDSKIWVDISIPLDFNGVWTTTTANNSDGIKNNTKVQVNPRLSNARFGKLDNNTELIVNVREAKRVEKASKEAISSNNNLVYNSVWQSVSVPLASLFNLTGVTPAQLTVNTVTIPWAQATWARVWDNIVFTWIANVDGVNDTFDIQVTTPGWKTETSTGNQLNDIDTLANAGALGWVSGWWFNAPDTRANWTYRVTFPENVDQATIWSITSAKAWTVFWSISFIDSTTLQFDYNPPDAGPYPPFDDTITFNWFKDEHGNNFPLRTLDTGILAP